MLAVCVFAQESQVPNKNRISINLGSMSPLGDLASDEVGFAEVGLGFSIDYAISVSKIVAVTMGFTSGKMKMNEDLFNQKYGVNSFYINSVGTGKRDYNLTAFVVGAEARTNGKHYFYFNPYFGRAKFVNPEQHYNFFDESNPNDVSKYVRINVVEKSAESLVYGFKMGANFSITDHIGIGLFGKYDEGLFSLSGKDSQTVNFETVEYINNSVVKFKSLTTGISLIFSF